MKTDDRARLIQKELINHKDGISTADIAKKIETSTDRAKVALLSGFEEGLFHRQMIGRTMNYYHSNYKERANEMLAEHKAKKRVRKKVEKVEAVKPKMTYRERSLNEKVSLAGLFSYNLLGSKK